MEDEQLGVIHESVAAIIGEQNDRLKETTKRQDLMMSRMSEELCELKNMLKNLHGVSHARPGEGSSKARLKLDLIRFSGEDPRGWIFQADEYFDYHEIREDARLQIVGFHMIKEARGWIRGLQRNKMLTTWQKFKDDLIERFGDSPFDDKLEELSRLQQTSTVAEYMGRFESLMNEVDQTEETLISYFIGGLKTEIKKQLKITRPVSLRKALAMAKVYEANANYKNKGGGNAFYAKSEPILKNPPTDTTAVPIVRRTLTAEERKERSAKGLCFNCDEKFIPGHKCRGRLFRMDTEQHCLWELVGMEDEAKGKEEEREDMEISLHALAGTFNPRTIRLTGAVQGQQLSVLIDSGSTHNFIQDIVAHRLGLELHPLPEFHVYIGSGEYLICRGLCEQVTICVQEATIKQNLYVLTMEGANIVLGIQWLETLGVVKTNYKELTMEFELLGKTIRIQGDSQVTETAISGKGLRRLVARQEVAYFCQLVCDNPLQNTSVTEEIAEVLNEFNDIFSEPVGMPPSRGTDHLINLLPDTQPINIHPYRYPHFQKNEIERLTAEMLQQGLIRPSVSPFSSPVLLVRKKDGTWRFCVDYRALNAVTIRDRFPIPTMDELMDELHGAKLFTKLDLRAGYHQIRVAEGDIAKTAFRTHHGHYEFTVMPFGLTNAPATFQSTMNKLLINQLRKNVVVFFDDILIYSKTVSEHSRHLKEVFSLLQSNSFFIRKTKCCFGLTELNYLGHIITTEGVKPDPEKLVAVKNWPQPKTVKQVRAFLGLTGYYRRFISRYAQIASPLTELLKKGGFVWGDTAEEAFELLKEALVSAPVLAYPDFSLPFIVETDACNIGVGAVLAQLEHPVAYYSRKLSSVRQKASTYAKELWAITEAVRKWRHYLLGGTFVIRTDHHSLKNLLEQTIQTPEQQYFLTKLLGYSFKIVYRIAVEKMWRRMLCPEWE